MRAALRSALSQAEVEDLVAKNLAALVKLTPMEIYSQVSSKTTCEALRRLGESLDQ
ncbi:hypothetical protein ABZ749_11780 [Micromonospora sp. NPDC047753]|uniref:hypothetical protein n=1 Tax=Micromonospora sp. NPDC047753 TaxID=3154817 RepID=UPI0033E4D3D3